MLNPEIRDQLVGELSEGGWTPEQGNRLLDSFEGCVTAMNAAAATGESHASVPLPDLASAVYAFGHLLGISVSVADATGDVDG
jgi:hypothetical protein